VEGVHGVRLEGVEPIVFSYKPGKKEDTVEWRMDAQKAGSCATFIYTSGTTGPPKAVMISHDSYTWVTDAISTNLKINAPEKVGKGRIISLLPLSHVAAQLLDLVVSVRVGANVFFTDPSALQGNLVKFLLACRPYPSYHSGRCSSVSPECGRRCRKESPLLGSRPLASRRRSRIGPRALVLRGLTLK
jgi:acyl-CoA synthetase (AMP-forming)/AMP-acid ligase II